MLAVGFYLRDLLWATTGYMLSQSLTGGTTPSIDGQGSTSPSWAATRPTLISRSSS